MIARRIWLIGQRTADEKIALFCKEKNCDLMTADKTAYLHYFAAGMTSVQITKYGEETEGDKYVYIIRIVG